MLFSLRNPSIALTPVVTLLLSYPFGVGWAYGTYLHLLTLSRDSFRLANFQSVMPKRKFKTFGYTWTLNNGPFNQKEHTLIVIMANASFGGTFAYSTDVLLAQQVYCMFTLAANQQILCLLIFRRTKVRMGIPTTFDHHLSNAWSWSCWPYKKVLS